MKNPKLIATHGSTTEKTPDQWVSGDDPMTRAQASYIATLSDETHHKLPKSELSKTEASKVIDKLKAQIE